MTSSSSKSETPILSPYGYNAKRIRRRLGIAIKPFTKEQLAQLDAILGSNQRRSKE